MGGDRFHEEVLGPELARAPERRRAKRVAGAPPTPGASHGRTVVPIVERH
jgi:hypothetical protein